MGIEGPTEMEIKPDYLNYTGVKSPEGAQPDKPFPMIRCKDHPRYWPNKEPRNDCYECKQIWKYRRFYESKNTTSR